MEHFRNFKYKRAALVVALAAVFVSMLPQAAKADAMTDGKLFKDHKTYAIQQAAIKKLNDAGKFPLRGYSISKAQCWLDVSFHEYTRNDRSAFPEDALKQSKLITEFLDSGRQEADTANPARQTPLINGATKLRPDLWDKAQRLKEAQGFSCVQQLVACAEVELVHAGNEHNQQGWRHAKPYVQIAEDKLIEAESGLSACAPKPVVVAPAPAPVPAPAAPLPPVIKMVTKDVTTLAAGALFKFDRRGEADMLPAGKAQLDEFAQKLAKVYERVISVTVVGHADRLGDDGYNAKLSLDRANTVAAYLKSNGVTVPMSASGKGESEPVVQCEGTKPTPELTACLQPNRRVEIEVLGIKR